MSTLRTLVTALALSVFAAPAPALAIDGPDWCESIELESSGFSRAALVHLPKGYTKSDADYPVVFMFHGGEGSAKQSANWWSAWKNEDVILVFPDGQREVKELSGWVAIDGDPLQHVKFVRKLVDELDARYRIDRKRLYATGFSNGAYMTNKLLCYAPDLFAGFGVVSQTLDLEDAKQCKARGEPVIFMIGDADEKSYWHGKPGTMSVDQTVDFLLKQGGCSKEKTVQTIDQPGDRTRVKHATFADCKKVPSIEFLHIQDGDHSWPGRDKDKPGQCRDVDAAGVVLDYWKRTAGL